MANNKVSYTIDSKCSVCGRNFNTIEESFKHEILEHSLKQKTNRLSRLQKRFNATAKILNTNEKLSERSQLKKMLKKCRKGDELKTIFELYCMKSDSLSLIFTRIQTCLEKELRSAGVVRIYPFGSIACDLALRDCDIDIYMDASKIQISPTHKHYIQKEDHEAQNRIIFNRITKLLYRSPHFTDIHPIRGARVPIIKCNHKDTGFSIDINISYPSSKNNSKFIAELVKCDERIHQLMLFIKIWAKNLRIIGRDNMTSHCLIVMVVFFLQQPWKSERKKENQNAADCRILKSIKELQENCEFCMVQGVNYAYNLTFAGNKPKIPTAVTTRDLIREFFNFYSDFNFETHIITPFYGKPVKKTNLTPDICDEYYKQLRTLTQFFGGKKVNDFQLDCSMCVQDIFMLNQNCSKNIPPQGKQFLVMCLRNASKICENFNQLKLGELYEQLLFETLQTHNPSKWVERNERNEKYNSKVATNVKNIKLPETDADTNAVANTSAANNNNNNNNNIGLVHTLVPSKADIRTLAIHYTGLPDGDTTIFRCWCEHYIKAIESIVTQLYRIDLQKHSPTQQKQQKLDKDGIDKQLSQSFLLSCTIDLWSNRHIQRNIQTSFMSYQMEQTERLHNLRRQDSKYSVSLNAFLELTVLPDYKGIKIKLCLPDLSPTTRLSKKSPLRKFFNMFKNTLNNYSIKETLDLCGTNENIKQPV